jgi:hypothetical protein
MATAVKKEVVRKTRTTVKKQEEAAVEVSLLKKFVFMDKPLALLEIGLKTETNIVLYGPGGHGKSELTMEFFYEKGINPYVLTMGTGMTTDRLFGGLDIPKYHNDGKLEYLVENSFMNHEYVVFEELMDSPDFILEQLKDILSSGVFRNGTQVYPIKTRFIVGNTNKTRAEFSKNDSLKALMERFPLEHNVVWANYTDISYTTLLENKFGKGQIDPVIPFLLQEYVKAGITISPRIALQCYKIYEVCGPDSLSFIAEFSKKPELIADALKKFEATIKFKEAGVVINEFINAVKSADINTEEGKKAYVENWKGLNDKASEVKKLVVNDSLAAIHAKLVKVTSDFLSATTPVYAEIVAKSDSVKEKSSKKKSVELVDDLNTDF